MKWTVALHDEFVPEYDEMPEDLQDELLAVMKMLEYYGPNLKRPHVDTLKGSEHANMKELRFDTMAGVWRFAFAFDARRQAIIFCGGDKTGVSERLFYKRLIAQADLRFTRHQKSLMKPKGKKR